MTVPSDIISSDIVNHAEDVFWQELPMDIPNGNGIKLLVVTTPFAVGSAEDTQLQKMMQAAQLSEADYYVLQLQGNMAWHKLRHALKPKSVLLLGVHPQQLGISVLFRLFVPNNFDGCLWIPSLSLTDMEQQTDAKKQLWVQGLKPVFVDKTAGNIE